jgi:DNA invertase Pin-like site-specific DNA recombinase
MDGFALAERPALALCLGYLRAGDTLVVWRLDRLGRSLRHLVETVNTLAGRGVAFASLREGIDTTTSTGRLIFHIFAALAEFERELIAERAAVGRQAARARETFYDIRRAAPGRSGVLLVIMSLIVRFSTPRGSRSIGFRALAAAP